MAGAALSWSLIPPVGTSTTSFSKTAASAVGGGAGLLLIAFHRSLSFYLRFVLKSLFRNLLRTGLTAAATMLLVFIVTLVWTVLYFLHMVTVEKSKDLKAIVTEKLADPQPDALLLRRQAGRRRRPPARRRHAAGLHDLAVLRRHRSSPASCGRARTSSSSSAMDPNKFLTMMDGIDEFTPDRGRTDEEVRRRDGARTSTRC